MPGPVRRITLAVLAGITAASLLSGRLGQDDAGGTPATPSRPARHRPRVIRSPPRRRPARFRTSPTMRTATPPKPPARSRYALAGTRSGFWRCESAPTPASTGS